jgi:hypothetical protein
LSRWRSGYGVAVQAAVVADADDVDEADFDALRNDTPMKSLEGDVGVRVGAAGTEDGIQIGIVVQEGLV